MDFLLNIVNFHEKELCFLCFKRSDNLESISKKLHIYENNNNTTSCIYSMMMYLFPSREIIFREVCQDCSKLILSMYLTLRRHDTKKVMFSIIIDDMLNGVDMDIKNADKPLNLHIKVPESCVNKSNSKKTSPGKLFSHVKLNLKEECKPLNKNLTKNEATVCDVCGKVCRTPNTLKAHLNCHRQKSCPYCLKVLKTHSYFKLHVKIHEGIKKGRQKDEIFYYCNDCEYRSLNKCSLQAHINKYHLRKRPFVCEICMKGFYKKSNLTEHVRTHRNVKNLTCEQCGETFVHQKTLMEHLRLHSGEKPFQCNICKSNFVTSGRRSDHIKRKHGEKNECCNMCGKKYSLKKDLNLHIRRVHFERTDSSKIQFLPTKYEFLDNNGDALPVLSSII